MKKETIKKLFSIATTKMQLEKMQLAQIRRSQEGHLLAAEKLRNEARKLRIDEALNYVPVDLRIVSQRKGYLSRQAKSKEGLAKNLEPALEKKARELKTAIQHELAWKNLADRVEKIERRKFNERAEVQREQLDLHKKQSSKTDY